MRNDELLENYIRDLTEGVKQVEAFYDAFAEDLAENWPSVKSKFRRTIRKKARVSEKDIENFVMKKIKHDGLAIAIREIYYNTDPEEDLVDNV